ncbi:MAG: hypothetical protein JW819_08615 [Candidatus Krumholzibacteriota bacterium]|nr:hypothetical protein [Candidatus Krumholzibacteriota bacterium]
MTKLENLRWEPRWVSYLGCLKGCLRHLGRDLSDAWLYGGTGHAFALYVHDAVCPSGPTALDLRPILALSENLGIVTEAVHGAGNGPRPTGAQQAAWDLARRALDAGRPCVAWELEIPEYYVVHGYDETGYYYSGPNADEGAGPAPWQDLGRTGIGLAAMASVDAGEAADDATTVREAVAYALLHAKHSGFGTEPEYSAGLAGYDSWIAALEAGRALEIGMAFNAAVWGECRINAARFLAEAAERLDGGAAPRLREAGARYEAVAGRLAAVARCFPLSQELSDRPLGVDERTADAAADLRAARDEEAEALELLPDIIEALGE